MYNYFHETTHDKKTRYKKSKLIIIFSLLGLMALSTHSFAERPPFEEREPAENTEACNKIFISAAMIPSFGNNNNGMRELIQEGCYFLLSTIEVSYHEEISYNHSAGPISAVPDSIKIFMDNYMGTLLSNTPNDVRKSYTSAYWNIFDLLFAYADIKKERSFYHLLTYGSGEQQFSPWETLYLAGRFLSREDTVRKLMEKSRPHHSIHSLDFPKSPQLSLLMPFGLPLTLLDTLQLYLSIDYDNLKPEQQQELARNHHDGYNFKLKLELKIEDLQKSLDNLDKKLPNKAFINDHKAAHNYLITQLSRGAVKNKARIHKGAIQVLNTSNAGTQPPCKKAKTDGKEAGTSSSVFMYGVITMNMLREALSRGLNPNTLISGIDFDLGTLEKIADGQKPEVSSSLLEWAAMGNIEGASPEEAVDTLIKAGANPHALPEEGKWGEAKQELLKILQNKVDALGLPDEEIKYGLHHYMLYDPPAPEAKFMRSAEEYLNAEVLNGPEMQISFR